MIKIMILCLVIFLRLSGAARGAGGEASQLHAPLRIVVRNVELFRLPIIWRHRLSCSGNLHWRAARRVAFGQFQEIAVRVLDESDMILTARTIWLWAERESYAFRF